MIKLPKQWKHWVSVANLRITDGLGKNRKGFHLKGRGFQWRVNCHGQFERGDSYDDFDRWALCKIDSVELSVIKSQLDFLRVVDMLVCLYDKVDK